MSRELAVESQRQIAFDSRLQTFYASIRKDNPAVNRLIEVGTKALRRVPVSGETLLTPRQQLRRLRASAFDLLSTFPSLLKSTAIARLSRVPLRYDFVRASSAPAGRFFLTHTVNITSGPHVIPKNRACACKALAHYAPAAERSNVA